MFAYQEGLYGVDKGAMHSFTHTINNEYYSDGIRAESLIIGLVATPGLGMPETDWHGFVIAAEHLARNALNLFGWKELYAATVGHAVYHVLGYYLPVWEIV